MGSSHWFFLIPFYFFGALTAFLVLVLLSRLGRFAVPINFVAMAAVAIGLAGVLVPPLTGLARVDDYTLGGMLSLAALSILLAYVDSVLEPRLPLPLDRAMREL
jgi:hypothetical protein